MAQDLFEKPGADAFLEFEKDMLPDPSEEPENKDEDQGDESGEQTSKTEDANQQDEKGGKPSEKPDEKGQDFLEQLVSEAEKAKNRLSEYEQFDPLVDRFKTDPRFQQIVAQYLQTGQIPGQQQFGQQYQPTQPPTDPAGMQGFNPFLQQQGQGFQQNQQAPGQQFQQPAYPKPPEDFDPYEISNPATPSGQWFQQVQQMNAQQVQSVQQQMQRAYQEQLETMQMEQLQREAQQRAFEDFIGSHRDIDQTEAKAFWQWASNPENVTVDTLFSVYKALNEGSNDNKPNQPRSQSATLDEIINKLRSNEQIPGSAANVGDRKENNEDEDEALAFVKDLGKGGWGY